MKIFRHIKIILAVLVLLLVVPNLSTAEDPTVLCTATIGCNGCSVVTEVFDNNTFSQTITCGEDIQTNTGSGAYCGTVCGFSACNSEVCELN